MKKIAVIGSTNVDLITYGDRVAKSGETLEAAAFAIGNGGKGANQAVAAAKLGSHVLMVSKVGDDQFAEMSLANYRSQHIDTKFVTKVSGVSTGVAPIFVNTTTSQNSILIVKGANNYLTPADIDGAEMELKTVDMIVLQLEVPLETVYHAIDLVKNTTSLFYLIQHQLYLNYLWNMFVNVIFLYPMKRNLKY